MKTKVILFSALTAMALIATGCGTDDGTPPPEIGDGNNTPDTTIKTGYLIDSAVEGASYSASSGLAGTTDRLGIFKFKNGDSVSFKIGNLSFGSVKAKKGEEVTPKMFTNDAAKQTFALKIMQAIDEDGKPENGITVPDGMFSDIPESDFVSYTEQSLLAASPMFREYADKDNDGVIDIDDATAIAHFEQTMTDWEAGKGPNYGNTGNSQTLDGGIVTTETTVVGTVFAEINTGNPDGTPESNKRTYTQLSTLGSRTIEEWKIQIKTSNDKGTYTVSGGMAAAEGDIVFVSSDANHSITKGDLIATMKKDGNVTAKINYLGTINGSTSFIKVIIPDTVDPTDPNVTIPGGEYITTANDNFEEYQEFISDELSQHNNPGDMYNVLFPVTAP